MTAFVSDGDSRMEFVELPPIVMAPGKNGFVKVTLL
jgi:hypothetical protein